MLNSARHIILLKEATAMRDQHCHWRVYQVRNNVYVGGMHQINVHVTAQTSGFPKTLTAQSTTLPQLVNIYPIVHCGAWLST